MVSIFETSAECREIKHKWCSGQAWDDVKDDLGPCHCNCHEPEEPEEAPAPADALQVSVYAEPVSNAESADTLRALTRLDIPHKVIHVVSSQGVLVAEFKHAAAELGVKPQLPCVAVYDPATDDLDRWFGYQPDKLRNLRGRITNSRKAKR